jgi:predicted lipoprotein with Yx(FWY)xxD motif
MRRREQRRRSSASTSAGGGGSSGGGATVDVAKNSQLGSILVDSQGRTLYTFAKDTGAQSTCMGACAQSWPPLTAKGHPTAGNGVNASMLGTSKRSDGSIQVTYGGHPLYSYTGDTAPGQVNGNGSTAFGAVWNAVQPSGAKAPTGGSSGGGYSSGGGGGSTSSGGGGGGGGYGY